MNIILAGDFWQLPPVRTNAIFSNPFKKGCYSAEEQRILHMFWHPEEKDSIQETYMLTKPMRTKDKWLQTTLDASREGRESWEMYCFTHGFPTRNPGTWFPGAAAPECGNPTCATPFATLHKARGWRILTLRAPAEAISVAGGSMAGWLGGFLARSMRCSMARWVGIDRLW